MGRNNKKKNKGKPKRLAVGNGEVSPPNNSDTTSEQNSQKQNLSDGESQIVGLHESDVEADKLVDNGVDKDENAILSTNNRNSKIRTGRSYRTFLFYYIIDEQNMVYYVMQSGFQEELRSLRDEIFGCIQKEENLEKAIEQLKSERDLFFQKEVEWETKFEQLQSQVGSCLSGEAHLKEPLMILGEDSSRNKESGKEEMFRLENLNSRLQVQVNELEMSRDRLVEENQLLANSVSDLLSRVQQLEATAITEAKIMVNETDNGSPQDYSISTTDPKGECSPSNKQEEELMRDHHLKGHDDSSGHAFESIPIHDFTNAGYSDDPSVPLDPSRTLAMAKLPREDEIQVEEDVVAGNAMQEQNIPLSDAPMIGAPFRLISFFTRYVSGADLVKEQESKVDR